MISEWFDLDSTCWRTRYYFWPQRVNVAVGKCGWLWVEIRSNISREWVYVYESLMQKPRTKLVSAFVREGRVTVWLMMLIPVHRLDLRLNGSSLLCNGPCSSHPWCILTPQRYRLHSDRRECSRYGVNVNAEDMLSQPSDPRLALSSLPSACPRSGRYHI